LQFFSPRRCRPQRPTRFPTRRSSDLQFPAPALRLVGGQDADTDEEAEQPSDDTAAADSGGDGAGAGTWLGLAGLIAGLAGLVLGDRKSTRLNSSHVKISYAVFCLKKK